MKIALVHNLKPPVKDPAFPADYYSECDSPKTIRAISSALETGGHTVFPVEADRNLPLWLAQNPVDLVFNVAEGFEGESREARVPALLDLLGIPYTGSGVLALALALDKAKSKQIFRFSGLPTPNFQLFVQEDDPLDPRLKFPLIVKPNREGSAKGILVSSVVSDETALRVQVRRVLQMYGQEALAEEFIEGVELTVGILGSDPVLPVLEIDFSGCRASGESFYSWRMKEYQGDKQQNLNPHFWCPARLDAPTTQAVQSVALKAARVLGVRDVARVDIRLSSEGIPFVLEVNPLPGIDPEESNLPIMTRAAGLSYEAFIQRLVQLAVERSNRKPDAHPASYRPSSHSTAPAPQTPRQETLPGPASPRKELSGTPFVAVRGKSRRRTEARSDHPKEENLGR